jgi:hypothetical protein
LEVPYVQSGHIEAQVQGGGSDDKVWEVDADTPAHLFTVNTSGNPCNFQR